MSGMCGDYVSLAEACGETEPEGLTFMGEDLYDADPEAMGLAMERDMASRLERAEERLERAERRLAELGEA